MISVKNLVKNFGNLEAVRDISFSIEPGEVFGLLGPNGAGKTTTVGMLTSEVKPTSGSAYVNDTDVDKNPLAVKKQIGVIPQHRSLDRRLTGRENIRVMAQAYGVLDIKKRIEEVLSFTELGKQIDSLINTYSGGMLQQLLIARALVHDPEIIFLDEPTIGLDPKARKNIWDKIEKLNSEGKTFLLTTHYMEEAEALCDRVAIMNNGKIIKSGTPKKLKEEDTTNSVIIIEMKNIPDSFVEKISNLSKVKDVRVSYSNRVPRLCVYVKEGRKFVPSIVDILGDNDIPIFSLDVRESTLEDVFTNLTGESLE
ncbi:MAG: ABC transporter ATP-binding protein [Elusimicrobiota bacterium]